MPLLAEVIPHLTINELRHRFRRCRHPVEKVHLLAILLRARGKGTSEVAEICGCNVDWIRRLVRRYNAGGPDALADGRVGKGRKPLLSDDQVARLRHVVLNEKPPDGGLWTGPKVASWMSKELGRFVRPQRAWVYLRRMGLTKKTPRPRHPEASAQEQAEFKKNSGVGWR